ncbi:MAG: hypothetical protein GXY83_24700 [Rhodopirellula sp.]|nr:hypothetical protein [Rhodopirellula sp.]
MQPFVHGCLRHVLWLAILITPAHGAEIYQADPSKTSTEWRDDAASLEVTAKLNQAYAEMPFSVEQESVVDQPPFAIDWTVGPNLPIAWKGGVAGWIDQEIVLTGGLWMPGRENLTYAFRPAEGTYEAITPAPVHLAYTQGASDGRKLYVVGGRNAGKNVLELSRSAEGIWQWRSLASLPESESNGRWLAAVGVLPDRWLFLVGGHPTGTPSETSGQQRMADLRLSLERPDAQWEPMAPYPAGKRNLLITAVARGNLYVFGGSENNTRMREIHLELAKKFKLNAPFNGVPNYRDAYCYAPVANQWMAIRPLPAPMVAGWGVVLQDRYILLMGSADVRSLRVGRSEESSDPHWRGYGDRILCYDIDANNYSRIGVMPYGVATIPWICDGRYLFGFGGEPAHGYNMNTENVVQIGRLQRRE